MIKCQIYSTFNNDKNWMIQQTIQHQYHNLQSNKNNMPDKILLVDKTDKKWQEKNQVNKNRIN